MTDKEFKRLSRAQLIEIIYRLQLQIDKLNEEKQALESQLNDKRLRLSKAGNIAEAALEINDCLRTVQNAADQYLDEIKAIREEAEAEKLRILAQAEAEASEFIAAAKGIQGNQALETDEALPEYEQSQSDNGL